jgi:hypothetical protein
MTFQEYFGVSPGNGTPANEVRLKAMVRLAGVAEKLNKVSKITSTLRPRIESGERISDTTRTNFCDSENRETELFNEFAEGIRLAREAGLNVPETAHAYLFTN